MDRDHFLDWALAMMAVQLGVPPTDIVKQDNNVQHGFSNQAVTLVRDPAHGVGIGVVGNIRAPEVRVHLFTYDAVRIAAWKSATHPYINALYGLQLVFRIGDNGNVAYLEFRSPVATSNDFERWCAPIFGYVAFFTNARAQGLLP